MSYCQCCDQRMAVVQTTYSTTRGKARKTYKFCRQCRKGHTFSPEIPAMSTIEDEFLKNQEPTQTNQGWCQTHQCWCCGLYFYRGNGLQMKYECGEHQRMMCTSCASHQKHCYFDKEDATPKSLQTLRELTA